MDTFKRFISAIVRFELNRPMLSFYKEGLCKMSLKNLDVDYCRLEISSMFFYNFAEYPVDGSDVILVHRFLLKCICRNWMNEPNLYIWITNSCKITANIFKVSFTSRSLKRRLKWYSQRYKLGLPCSVNLKVLGGYFSSLTKDPRYV